MRTYCVFLHPQHSLNTLQPRAKRYYLEAKSAAQAMLIASSEDPEWLVFGVEPASLSAPQPQGERSGS
jgi:tRNA(Leu) C34 or U34 (ribose-2'-O)-methylase TrmL